jgi:putative transposase
VRSRLLVSERRTCAVVGQPRVTQRRRPLRDDEAALMADDVLQYLTDLFVEHGPPEHIRSDNGPEFAAKAVRHWLGRVGVKTLFIEPGSPWEIGYCESFNSELSDELLNGEIFATLREAQVLIGNWRRH